MLMAAAVAQSSGGILGWLFGFADGGVMPGKMIKKYAGGGVANSPQLAMFGEGGGAEAFVPLPDGRSIPVDLGESGSGGASVGAVNVMIEANDTKGFDRLLHERQDLIVGLITQAVDQSLSTKKRFQM
jgi:phage-related minor tail protein